MAQQKLAAGIPAGQLRRQVSWTEQYDAIAQFAGALAADDRDYVKDSISFSGRTIAKMHQLEAVVRAELQHGPAAGQVRQGHRLVRGDSGGDVERDDQVLRALLEAEA